MSHFLSRRQLAEYAADQIIAGEPVDNISKRLAAVLTDTKRTKDAELLARDIAWELETRGKVANAQITSATKLSDEILKDLTDFIKSSASVDSVNLQENIDKSVIGGVKIETAVHSWDKTIATKLNNIREAF